uniref:Histone H4 transcription factor n=1 Tax=Syphacia muris TaxID=451379 RepID=A0A0N5A926_9BILA
MSVDAPSSFQLSWIKCRCLFMNCSACFEGIKDLTDHIRDHIANLSLAGKVSSYICPVKGCGHDLSSVVELQRHLHMHIFHAQRQHAGLLAISSKVELAHLNSCCFPASSKLVYDGTLLQCEWEKCSLFFDDVVSYVDHIQGHINALCITDRDHRLLYNCGWNGRNSFSYILFLYITDFVLGCRMTFRNKSNLRTHVKHHSGDKTTACPFCGAFFSNNSKLFNHMVRKVPANDNSCTSLNASSAIACQFCQKSFESERLFREHIRRHVMNYKCQFCSTTVDCPSALHRHILNVHANLKQFSCKACPRKYAQKADLDRHIEAIHAADFAYDCSECGKKFRWRKQLVSHLRKHKEGYQPYTHLCHLCNAKYANGFGLSRHLKKKHKCQVPVGFTRYQYKKCADGFMRLQTKRCLSKSLALQLGIPSNDANYVTVRNL